MSSDGWRVKRRNYPARARATTHLSLSLSLSHRIMQAHRIMLDLLASRDGFRARRPLRRGASVVPARLPFCPDDDDCGTCSPQHVSREASSSRASITV